MVESPVAKSPTIPRSRVVIRLVFAGSIPGTIYGNTRAIMPSPRYLLKHHLYRHSAFSMIGTHIRNPGMYPGCPPTTTHVSATGLLHSLFFSVGPWLCCSFGKMARLFFRRSRRALMSPLCKYVSVAGCRFIQERSGRNRGGQLVFDDPQRLRPLRLLPLEVVHGVHRGGRGH